MYPRATILMSTMVALMSVLLVQSQQALAVGMQVATIARLEGDARIFLRPIKDKASLPKEAKAGDSPYALYDGTYYAFKAATVGDKLELGNMLQTGTTGKARLIYRNGDQITVSENTTLRLKWNPKTEAKPQFEVIGGMMRAIFLKGGPRKDSEVTTRTLSMGIRGTDFVVSSGGGGSKVSILRGEVSLRANTPDAEPVKVAAGFSAVVPPPDVSPAHASQGKKIAVAPTTGQQLLAIQKGTLVKKAASKGASDSELKELEKHAVDNSLADIKQADPALYEKISQSKNSIEDADGISLVAVREQYKKVEMDKAREKPASLKDVEDVYDKYFDGN